MSKAVKATVGATERRTDFQPEWHMARKTTKIEQVLSKFSTCSMSMRKRRLSGTETGCESLV